jgi:CubicO group peptidase (beta-lactamase class C family)
MKMKTAILFCLAFLYCCQGQAQPDISKLEALIDKANISGGALATVNASGMKQVWCFGHCHATTKVPVTQQTVFEAASLSKPVFAVLVLKLADKGIIDLKKPLIEYLPFSALSDDRAKEITAIHVLTHSTGLPNWFKKPSGGSLKFSPGTAFNYSGEGYDYLQRVIEDITGKSIDELMQEHIFTPYGMKNSSFTFNDSIGNFAFPHDKKGNVHPKKKTGTNTSAASSLHTTLEDYSQFLTGLAANVSATNEMYPQVIVNARKHLFWGMGIGIEKKGTDTFIWHWGNNWDQFKSVFVYSLNSNSGYLLFTNSANGHSVMQELNEQLLHKELEFPNWLGYKQVSISDDN